MHHYPFHPGDYTLSTNHWSEDRAIVECEAGLLRDLAYRRLLDLYYGEEEPIPSKTRLVAIRIRMLKHEEIVASVLREKFTLTDGYWRQDRVESEVVKYQKRAAASRENGRRGGRPKNLDKPNRLLTGGKQALTKNHKPRTSIPPMSPEGVVAWDEFWNIHPRKVGKPAALAAFKAAIARGTSPADIVAGAVRHQPAWEAKKAAGDGEKIPHPTTWLNRDGWNDEVMPVATGGRAKDWWETADGVIQKGLELCIPAPADDTPQAFRRFKATVWVAMGHEGPWWDKTDTAYPVAVKLRDGGG